MGKREIRTSQLIRPFGPGSIYIDSKGIPLIIAGLDNWFKRDAQGGTEGIVSNKFDILEPRISEQIGIDYFKRPPDFRQVPKLPNGERGENDQIYIPAYRFPTWYRNDKTGKLRQFSPDTRNIRTTLGQRWIPVRFISVCKNGHIGEFPWQEWIGCTCSDPNGLRYNEKGGASLSSIWVSCTSCKKGRSLEGTTTIPSDNAESTGVRSKSAFESSDIPCSGSRPWLNDNNCSCDAPLVAALVNQQNLYFGKVLSAISLPMVKDVDLDRICVMVKDDPGIGHRKIHWQAGGQDDRDEICETMCARFLKREIKVEKDVMQKALETVFAQKTKYLELNAAVPHVPESVELAFRRSEFNILRSDNIDYEDLSIRNVSIPPSISGIISKINLVERLKETTVFLGFDRLGDGGSILEGLPNLAVEQLYANVPEDRKEWWLPANVVSGEGLYFELSDEKIRRWQKENHSWLKKRFRDDLIHRLGSIEKVFPPKIAAPTLEWASRFILTHTFSHLILKQLVFECGYASSSLRERIYVSDDTKAPMSGIMLYTSAGDAEGTLGGLIRLGRPEFFGGIVDRALRNAIWCSADPVCSEPLGPRGTKKVNMSACHSCSLLPETACESFNHGLDRTTVVGSPRDRNLGFAYDLIKDA